MTHDALFLPFAREFVTEQARGEWTDLDIEEDTQALAKAIPTWITRAGLRVVSAEPSEADVERARKAVTAAYYAYWKMPQIHFEGDDELREAQARAALRAFLAQGGGDDA